MTRVSAKAMKLSMVYVQEVREDGEEMKQRIHNYIGGLTTHAKQNGAAKMNFGNN